MKQTCILVDDEPLAREKLEMFIGKLPNLQLLQSFSTALEAMSFLANHTVDILFLDIQMPDLTGTEMLGIMKDRPPHIIFTTAYSDWAMEGYELNVTDYLLKPFSFDRFIQAVEKTKTKSKPIANRDFIFVKTDYRIIKINYADILYIEGMRDYRAIITTGKKILTLQTFSSLEECLPENLFIRVHKSYMVSFINIDSVERHRISIGGKLIPISDTYKDSFYDKLQ